MHYEEAFARVGWFIPPFAQMGFLSEVASDILRSGSQFSLDDLESALTRLYEPHGLAAMVTDRYSTVPFVSKYKATIAEAIEAHFLGLNHVAVAGLIPVVEGAGRQLLDSRQLVGQPVKTVFSTLAEDCKRQAIAGSIGAVGEVVSMLDSFSAFTTNTLYANSKVPPPLDGTNRHGIAHGYFQDSEYGRPLNFFKTIGAVDFLMFVASFNATMSWFAPVSSPKSEQLASYYIGLQSISMQNPRNNA